MGISSTIVEQALRDVNELALPLAGATSIYLMVSRRVTAEAPAGLRPRNRRSPAVRRLVSILGFALTLASPAGAAERTPGRGRAKASGSPVGIAERTPGRGRPKVAGSPVGIVERTLGPHPGASDEQVTFRSEPGRFPPPRLPGSAEPSSPVGGGLPPPWIPEPDALRLSDRAGARGPLGLRPPSERTRARESHPAVHAGRRRVRPGPLFSRWAASPSPAAAPMTAGMAGTRQGGPDVGGTRATPAGTQATLTLAGGRLGWHAVLPGETLWSIAADRLHTEDIRRIARYWPRIHRANREEIGPNPDLIRPGQVLELPSEHA